MGFPLGKLSALKILLLESVILKGGMGCDFAAAGVQIVLPMKMKKEITLKKLDVLRISIVLT
jgi:hypothetical protein